MSNLHNASAAVSERTELSLLVKDFVEKHRLSDAMKLSEELAANTFELVDPPAFAYAKDAEAGDEWIDLDVNVRGETSALIAAHDRYTLAWLKSVPAAIHSLIRLQIHPV